MKSKNTDDEDVEALDALGSDGDPIWHHGKETTPRELSYEFGNRYAASLRIDYYGTRGKQVRRIRNGTLRAMLIERASTL